MGGGKQEEGCKRMEEERLEKRERERGKKKRQTDEEWRQHLCDQALGHGVGKHYALDLPLTCRKHLG